MITISLVRTRAIYSIIILLSLAGVSSHRLYAPSTLKIQSNWYGTVRKKVWWACDNAWWLAPAIAAAAATVYSMKHGSHGLIDTLGRNKKHVFGYSALIAAFSSRLRECKYNERKLPYHSR